MIIDITQVDNDVNKFAEKIGEQLGEIMYDLVGMFNQEWVNLSGSRDVLDRVLYGFNLSPVDGKFAFEMDNNKINIYEHWRYIFKHNYIFANGESIQNKANITEFLLLSQRYLLLLRANPYYTAKVGSDVWSELDKLDEISLNYSTAVAKVHARYSFTTAVANAKIGHPSIVNARTIATIADVSQAYIFTLIAKNIILAEKNKNNWLIDTMSALNWLQNRKKCQDWVKRL